MQEFIVKLAPQKIVKWECGISSEVMAVPTPFDQVRAWAIKEEADKRAAKLAQVIGSSSWMADGNLYHVMTDGELAYIKCIFDVVPGWWNWMMIFIGILNDDIKVTPAE